MISIKTFRPIAFLAVASVFTLLACTSVEAMPYQALSAAAADPLRCVDCPEPPQCGFRNCRYGWYCETNYCTCRLECKEGILFSYYGYARYFPQLSTTSTHQPTFSASPCDLSRSPWRNLTRTACPLNPRQLRSVNLYRECVPAILYQVSLGVQMEGE
ncbi:MAG: hypothetical protein JOS17DRAFT_831840 [Linnemannia elongata]|nr:MAG: hypothetical protein JOS17DRAFT_831840 [Linnemannia elongata]